MDILKWMSMTLIKGDITDEEALSHENKINVKTMLKTLKASRQACIFYFMNLLINFPL